MVKEPSLYFFGNLLYISLATFFIFLCQARIQILNILKTFLNRGSIFVMAGSSKIRRHLFWWRDVQFKVTWAFSTNKHPYDWNEIHKLKPQLFSSTNIWINFRLPTTLRLTLLILLITRWLHTSSRLTSCFSNDSYSFLNISTVSSLNNINLLLSSQLNFSFSMRTLYIFLSSSKSIFLKDCSSLSKQLNMFQIYSHKICIGPEIWFS